jgi:hypothetical protein
MTIVPTPIVSPDPADYEITDPSSTSLLNVPSHAGLHAQANDAVQLLNGRVTVIEQNVNNLWPQVQQARLVATTWLVPGTLSAANNNKLLLPLIWNMTGRAVDFSAAKITIFTPPTGAPITVDILTGTTLSGGMVDVVATDSILTTPLSIPVGEFYSAEITAAGSGFVGQHGVGTYVVAAVTGVGSGTAGADLTIQLNRLL